MNTAKISPGHDDDHDRTGEQLQHTDTRWGLELDNPYPWMR